MTAMTGRSADLCLALVLLVIGNAARVDSDCNFDYSDVPQGHINPFLVDPDRRQFVYPDIVAGQQRVTISRGASVLVSCPGDNNALSGMNQPNVLITCDNSQLRRGNTPVSWADLSCKKETIATLKQEGNCGKDRRKYEIGWTIQRDLFVPQITLCFDIKQETSVSAAHKIQGKFIDAKVVEPSRPSFKTNGMFSVNLNRIYKKTTQKTLAEQLLRTTDYLTTKGQHYLARGHLAPDADFVLEAEQDATYYYGNVVPQWQAVNNGNWKSLEFAVRKLAESRQANFEVYSGSHGILELPDLNNNPTKLFLGEILGKKVVPVPALLWKVIYDPAAGAAVAFAVVNDIQEGDTWSVSHPPCPDMCSRIPWVDWDTSSVAEGLTFCCTVHALRSTIPHVPALKRVDLLV